MQTDIYQRLVLLIVILVLITLAAGLSLAQAQTSQPKTLDRNLEPVVRLGSQVTGLLGSPVDELFVYRFDGVTPTQIPAQVDEVTASGSYTTTEDGLLDGNDEIVFMAADLGDRPADPAALLAMLPISATWYEIEVADPLEPARQGWAYLVRSATFTPTGDDYVTYDYTTQHISTSQYTLGFTTTLPGLNYLDHNGSGDILDRTKLRVTFNSLFTLYENDLSDDLETHLIKDGPVRVIVRQSVVATPGGVDLVAARVDTINRAYPALVQSTASISFTLLPFIDITRVRTSIDFNSHIASTGVATFYNRVTPAGVAIDGMTDTIAALPFSPWGQASHPYGRIVQVTDPGPIGGSPANYYCDNNNPAAPAECDGTNKTGDNMSYGDSGFSITGDINSHFATESWLFFLPPPATGEADNVGDTYQDYFDNPLSQIKIFLPIIVKNG